MLPKQTHSAPLSAGYRAAAHTGNWQVCKRIAEQMRGLDGDGSAGTYVRGRLTHP